MITFAFAAGLAPAETIKNPCIGETALLNIVDRPTKADSVCVVSEGGVVLEAGGQVLQLIGEGSAINLPEAELRIGLPWSSELAIVLPNWSHQSVAPTAGWSSMTAGIKHELGYHKKWFLSAEALFTLPTGSDAFGNSGVDPSANAIVNYTFNEAWSATLMMGVASYSDPQLQGGGRFTTINPDFVLTWQVNPKVQILGEIYAQSHTSADQGFGTNANLSLLILPLKFLELDLTYSQRVQGPLSGFERGFGAGLSLSFEASGVKDSTWAG